MKIRTMLGLVFLVAAAVGFSYCVGYAHGRLAASRPASTPPATTVMPESMPRANSTSAEPRPIISGMSKEAILQLLPSKTWYSHWEIKDRNRPTQFRILENGQIHFGNENNSLTLELRWVLNQGGHMFVPIDERTIHGFYIPSGRQKGFFADK